MSRIVTLALALLLVGAAGAPPAAASSPVTVVADLEGAPIPASQIPDWFCHDRDFPLVHCFRAAASLESARAALDSPAAAASGVTASLSSDYVVVYSSTLYAGSYMYVSQDYDALAIVGWNDRIRSYRGLNAGLGTFWTDWFAGGSRLDFCCNAQAPSLSGTFDRAISSVYRR